MGAEAKCRARVGSKTTAGKALLETTELVFRSTEKGVLRVVVAYQALTRCVAKDGALELRTPDMQVTLLDLGPLAARWADKIANPPSLLTKLGVKPRLAISIVGAFDAPFLAELRARADLDVTIAAAPRAAADLIFYAAGRRADLARLPKLRASLAPAGALWIIRPKGVDTITERDVMAAGKDAGLVDVKVAAFSATHTAEKFVIPVSRR